jgi:hypothetical protein
VLTFIRGLFYNQAKPKPEHRPGDSGTQVLSFWSSFSPLRDLSASLKHHQSFDYEEMNFHDFHDPLFQFRFGDGDAVIPPVLPWTRTMTTNPFLFEKQSESHSSTFRGSKTF